MCADGSELDFDNLARLQTSGANLDRSDAAVHDGLYPDDVRFPHPSCLVVSMADVIAGDGSLATDIASTRHFPYLVRS